MNASRTHVSKWRAPMLIALAMLFALAPAARAAIVSYTANLDGPSESPPNASPGIGLAVVDVDATANTMHVHVNFSGLIGATTASHIHAPTLVPLTGTAGVATTTPYFSGFPIGVMAGTYDNTLDMTLASSYNPSFVTANGSSIPASEAALFAAIAAGQAYLNVHSQAYPEGEIRGFLVPETATPASHSTWGRIKNLYR
jgi:hypothetical protein